MKSFGFSLIDICVQLISHDFGTAWNYKKSQRLLNYLYSELSTIFELGFFNAWNFAKTSQKLIFTRIFTRFVDIFIFSNMPTYLRSAYSKYVHDWIEIFENRSGTGISMTHICTFLDTRWLCYLMFPKNGMNKGSLSFIRHRKLHWGEGRPRPRPIPPKLINARISTKISAETKLGARKMKLMVPTTNDHTHTPPHQN